MTTALSIAAVTSVLKDLLDNRLVERSVTGDVGDVIVSALPPDRVPIGAEERTRLNLFMYRVTPHSNWRRMRGESDNGRGDRHLPLSLDLHYLLTAYGEEDLHAEILLGYAVQVLHETPILTREAFLSSLSTSRGNGSNHGSSSAPSVLSAFTLADQVQEITICPEFLSMEETTKLWSALQAHYRPSAVYEISAILIDSE